MFFKRILALLTLVLSTFLLSGCGALRDQDFESRLKDAGPNQPECLSSLPEDVGHYFMGEVQDADRAYAIWDCATSGMEAFRNLTRGENADFYTPQEIQGFFNRYFASEHKISNALTSEVMKLKVAFFGGTTNKLTRYELGRIADFMRLVGVHAVNIRGLMPLSGKEAHRLTTAQVETSIDALRTATEALGTFFQDSGGSYSFDDAARLFTELENTYEELRTPDSGIRFLREQIPLFKAVKAIFLNSDSDRIERSEWIRFLQFGARIHAIFFEYIHQDLKRERYEKWFSTAGMARLEVITHRVVDLIQDASQFHENGTVKREYILNLISVLKTMKADGSLSKDSRKMTEKTARFAALMLLGKQFVFGGPLYEWDMTHATYLRGFITNVKEPVAKLYETFVLNKNQLESMPAKHFEPLVRGVPVWTRSVVNELLTLRAVRNYTERHGEIDELLRRIDGLTSTERDEDGATEYDDMRSAVEVGFSLKGLFAGAPYDVITPNHFRIMLQGLPDLSLAYLHSFRKAADEESVRERAEVMWPLAQSALQSFVQTASLRETPVNSNEVLALLNQIPDRWWKSLEVTGRNVEFFRSIVPGMFEVASLVTGSNSQSMTGANWQQLLNVLNTAYNKALPILSYMPLSTKKISLMSEDEVEELSSLLLVAGREIVEVLSQSAHGNYNFESVRTLLGHYRNSIDPEHREYSKKLEQIDDILKMIPLIASIKAVMVRPEAQIFRGTDFTDSVNRGFKTASVGLRMYHLWKTYHSLSRGRDFRKLHQAMYEIFDLMKEATLNRGTFNRDQQGILFEELDAFLDEFFAWDARTGEKTINLTLGTTKDFLRPLVRRLLAGVRWDQTGRNANGIRVEAVNYMKLIFDRWAKGASFIERIYGNLGNHSEDGYESDGYLRERLLSEIGSIERSMRPQSDPLDLKVVRGLRTIVETYKPLFLGNDTIVSMVYDRNREYLYSFNNMAQMNTYWTFASVLMQAYADQRERGLQETMVTLGELTNFSQDLLYIMREIKMSAPDKPADKLAKQRMFESNMFTSVGNGDENLEMKEATEFLAFMISDREATPAFYDDILDVCPNGPEDYTGKPVVPLDCFKQHFFNENWFYDHFKLNFPRLAYFFARMQGEPRTKFIRDMEFASRANGITNEPISSSEVENFVMIPIYVESLIKRFDIDRDGRLSIEESLDVYPLVCPLLKKVSGMDAECVRDDNSLVNAAFGYMIRYGESPTTTEGGRATRLGQKLAFLRWAITWRLTKAHPDRLNRRFYVDRAKIMAIIGALAAETANTSAF